MSHHGYLKNTVQEIDNLSNLNSDMDKEFLELR